MSSPEVEHDNWTTLLAQLTQLQDGKPDYAGGNYLHDRNWTDDAVSAELARLEAEDVVLERLMVLRRNERSKLKVAKARASNGALPACSLPEDVLLVIFEYFMLTTTAYSNPATLAAVCFTWMNLVLGDRGAAVWSHIMVGVMVEPFDESSTPEDVHEWIARRTRHFLLRSRSHPLHLYFDGILSRQILDLALNDAHSHRIQTIHSYRGGLFPGLPLRIEFPSLRAICIDGMYDYSRAGSPASSEHDADDDDSILVSAQCTALDTVVLSTDEYFVAPALRDLSTWAHVTRLSVKVKNHTLLGRQLGYDALVGMTELRELEWTDLTPPSTAESCSFTLLKLNTLSLFGPNAIHHLLSGTVHIPALRHFQLILPNESEAVLTPSASVEARELQHLSTFIDRYPELEVVRCANIELHMPQLFSLLASHPTLREFFWDCRKDALNSLFASMALAGSLAPRIIASARGDGPFVTLDYPSSPSFTPVEDSRETAEEAERRAEAARRMLHGRFPPLPRPRAVKPVPPRETPLEQFSKCLVTELESLHKMNLQTSRGASSSPIFRIGVTTDLAARSPAISNFAQQSPDVLSVRPRWFV